jgi:DnaJ-class molecular chaperone
MAQTDSTPHSKVGSYKKERVEVCRNCLGVGLASAGNNAKKSECHICGGSGLVKKTWDIEITIAPHSRNMR